MTNMLKSLVEKVDNMQEEWVIMAERWKPPKGNDKILGSSCKTLGTQDQRKKDALCGQLIPKKQGRGRYWTTDVGLLGQQ